MTHAEITNVVEAALFAAAGEPLSLDRLQRLFPEDAQPTRDEILAALHALDEACRERSIELKQIDRGFRFQTRERYAGFIARLHEERPPRYSRATLETLAIIAYRQPVTRAEIEEIRGVSVSSEIIKTLLGREWIREVGKREVPGRPTLYGTTREFLGHFNLRSLDELPPLSALRDIDKLAAELNYKLPIDTPPAAPADGGPETDTAGANDVPDSEEAVPASSTLS